MGFSLRRQLHLTVVHIPSEGMREPSPEEFGRLDFVATVNSVGLTHGASLEPLQDSLDQTRPPLAKILTEIVGHRRKIGAHGEMQSE